MRKFFRQLLIRLLMATVAVSPLQIATATDFNQFSRVTNCPIMQMPINEFVDMHMDRDCLPDQGGHCVELSICLTVFNLSSLQSSSAFLLLARVAIHKKYTADSDAISTYYPELEKRPPRA